MPVSAFGVEHTVSKSFKGKQGKDQKFKDMKSKVKGAGKPQDDVGDDDDGDESTDSTDNE